MTKSNTSVAAIVISCIASLICIGSMIFHYNNNHANIANEEQSNQYGKRPSDSDIMNAFRVYAHHNVPAGLFGEATENLYIKKDPASLVMVKEVNRVLSYVAAADGLGTKEVDFASDIVHAVTAGRISKATVERALRRSVSKAEALSQLRKHHPYMRLYFMVVMAGSDNDFTETEKNRLLDLAESADLDGQKVLDIIDNESKLLQSLIGIMGPEEGKGGSTSASASSMLSLSSLLMEGE